MRSRFSGSTTLGVTILALVSSFAASAGTIYVDDDLGALYKFTTAGVRSVFSNSQGQSDIGLAVDSSGDVFAADRDSNEILKYSPGGTASVFATPTDPYGIAVDSSGNVYAGTQFGSTITKYTPAGVGTVFATGTGVFALTFDASGDLFDGEQNGNIYEYAPNGTRTLFGSVPANGTGGSAFVGGLAFDPSGNLYVADWNSQIVKFAPNGTSTVFANFSTSTLPTGLVYDNSTGDLYMTEVANGVSQPGQQAVDVFSPSGAMSTFASGLYDPYGIADLQGSAAPEPGSIVLICAGLAVIGLGRLRKLRNQAA
jgi:sugar lactone lactonase YvrE